MSGQSALLTAGEGDSVSLRGTEVTFKVRGDQADGASCLEFAAAPGFDTGLHVHSKLEETFYVLEGEFELRIGEEVRRALPGSVSRGATRSASSLRRTSLSASRRSSLP